LIISPLSGFLLASDFHAAAAMPTPEPMPLSDTPLLMPIRADADCRRFAG
jgi:hypothetical protein